MRLTIVLPFTLVALPSCSPSRVILDYADPGEQADSTTGEAGEGSEPPSDESPDDGAQLDLGEPPPPMPSCTKIGWLTDPSITHFVGPVHHDGNLYWGEWGQEDDEAEPIQAWWWETLVPEAYTVVVQAGASSPAHSLDVDDSYLYASGLDRNPIRIPVEGGVPESIPGPLGYGEGSGELLVLLDNLYWLNHANDEITLIRTQLEALDSIVLLDEPIGEQLAGSEETGLFVLRAAGASTDILRVDPIFGISEDLVEIPTTSENVGELLVVEDELYVVYTSANTAQIDRVTFDGVSTTVVEPGNYTLITHPVVFNGQLYFEFADPEFAWGRVGLEGGGVEAFVIENSGVEPRWQPITAVEDCLVIRISTEPLGHNTAFELYGFPG